MKQGRGRHGAREGGGTKWVSFCSSPPLSVGFVLQSLLLQSPRFLAGSPLRQVPRPLPTPPHSSSPAPGRINFSFSGLLNSMLEPPIHLDLWGCVLVRLHWVQEPPEGGVLGLSPVGADT